MRKSKGKTELKKSFKYIGRLLLVFFALEIVAALLGSPTMAIILLVLLFLVALPFLIVRGVLEDERNSILTAMITLISVVMNADGRNTKPELEEVKNFLVKRFENKKVKQMLLLLKDKLNVEYRNIRAICLELNKKLSYPQRLDLIELFFRIAEANGEICQYEAVRITQIAREMKIDNDDFVVLTSTYTTFYNYKKRQAQTFTSRPNLSWAYQVLMISEQATMEEIKKAYRRLAMLYHPDKAAPRDTAAQMQAAEKFRLINKAYEELKKSASHH